MWFSFKKAARSEPEETVMTKDAIRYLDRFLTETLDKYDEKAWKMAEERAISRSGKKVIELYDVVGVVDYLKNRAPSQLLEENDGKTI